MTHFLIVDDDENWATVLVRSLRRRQYQASVALTGAAALLAVTAQDECPVTHVILDMKLAETSGLQLLPGLLAQSPALKIVILTGYASVATTVEAIKRGAFNYLCKPATVDDILAAFELAEPGMPAVGEEVTEKPLSVNQVEWEYIQRQLQANNGNIAATARALNMHRRTLQRKLQKRPSPGEQAT